MKRGLVRSMFGWVGKFFTYTKKRTIYFKCPYMKGECTEYDSGSATLLTSCRDCKYMVRDKVYEQVLLCDNENLKIGIVFSHEGGQLSVDEDFGCVQFENRI